VQELSVTASADTYIKKGSPNQNQAAETVLVVSATAPRRGLVQFDPTAIRSAVGTSALRSAILELTIKSASNLDGAGRAIGIHRLTKAWTESGATWACAVDSNPSNSNTDCSGATAWTMYNPAPPNVYPYVETPSDTEIGRAHGEARAGTRGERGGAGTPRPVSC
jgi:hypothetical protein